MIELASQVNQCKQRWKSLLPAAFGFCRKFIAERGLALRDDENVGSSRKFVFLNLKNFFQEKFQKNEDAVLLVTDFATVSQIANHYQISFVS